MGVKKILLWWLCWTCGGGTYAHPGPKKQNTPTYPDTHSSFTTTHQHIHRGIFLLTAPNMSGKSTLMRYVPNKKN